MYGSGAGAAAPGSSRLLDHPDSKECLSEITRFAARHTAAIDDFFWLRATRKLEPNGLASMRIVGADAVERDREVFRIANLVLQGGGVLGLAHAGFVAGMEAINVRFAGIAGASAGAIMAAGMAVVRGGDLFAGTSRAVGEIVADMPMASFIDGPYRTRKLIKRYLLGRSLLHLPSLAGFISATRLILRRRGLNSGNAFEDWLQETFKIHGVPTIDALDAILEKTEDQLRSMDPKPPALKDFFDNKEPIRSELLQLMAAAIPVGIKLQFPRDIELLAAESAHNSPAMLVRASMAIPLFFEPPYHRVAKEAWRKFVGDRLERLLDDGTVKDFAALDEIGFLDGGIFSNLPVDAFRNILPNVPTIAVPLTSSGKADAYRRHAGFGSLASEAGTVFFMIRNQRDRDAIEQLDRLSKAFDRRKKQSEDKADLPPSYPFRLATIDVGTANWLNFVMDDAEMRDLFLMGLRRALKFLHELVDPKKESEE